MKWFSALNTDPHGVVAFNCELLLLVLYSCKREWYCRYLIFDSQVENGCSGVLQKSQYDHLHRVNLAQDLGCCKYTLCSSHHLDGILDKESEWETRGGAQFAECLPSRHRAQDSVPSTTWWHSEVEAGRLKV